MRINRKKLLSGMAAAALMVSVATADVLTGGDISIIPDADAAAFSDAAEEALENIDASFDITQLTEDAIAQNRTELLVPLGSGTYYLTGTNVVNEGTQNECHMDMIIQIPNNVEVNLILDDLHLRGGEPVADGNGFDGLLAMGMDSVANLYIKSDSSLKNCSCEPTYTLTTDHSIRNTRVNIMESEGDAELYIERPLGNNVTVAGGSLVFDSTEIARNEVTVSDGSFVWENVTAISDLTVDGGYVDVPNAVTAADTDGNTLYAAAFEGLPADEQLTELNGKTFSHSYTDENGCFKTFLPLPSQEGITTVTVGGTKYFAASVTKTEQAVGNGTRDCYIYSQFTAFPELGSYKLKKVYDGTTDASVLTADGEFIMAGGMTAVPDLTDAVLSEKDAGMSVLADVPFTFTFGDITFTEKYDIAVVIEPAELSVASVAVEEKTYDGTRDATVSSVTFRGLVAGDSGVDYTAEGVFADALPGTLKDVEVTITLNSTNYFLENNIVTAYGDILPVGAVAAPVITPTGHITFEDTVEVSISCDTEGAEIYYTLDGNDPTPESTLYEGGFTVSDTTTVKAIAVKEGWEDSTVTTTQLDKEDAGGSGGSSDVPGGPGEPYMPGNYIPPDGIGDIPFINGEPMNWSSAAYIVSKLSEDDKVHIDMNGCTDIPAEFIQALMDSGADATFELNALISWLVDGEDILTACEADLDVTYPVTLDTSSLGGREELTFRIGDTKLPTKFVYSFGRKYAGLNAYLYKRDGDSLTLTGMAVIGEDGNAVFPLSDAGEYALMLGNTITGDLNGNGELDEQDAQALLDAIVNGNARLDYNGDGRVNAYDAADILADIAKKNR